MRNRNVEFLVSLLLLGECIAKGGAAGAPSSSSSSSSSSSQPPRPRIPLLPSLLRGGSSPASSEATRTKKKKHRSPTRQPNNGGVNPVLLVLDGTLGKAKRGIDGIGKDAGRELGKMNSAARRFVANVPKPKLPRLPPLLPIKRKRKKRNLDLKSCKKLDDACRHFSSALLRGGDEVDTARLLKACRAHLALMKTGGSSLKLVAKDLESNVVKAERVFKKRPSSEGARLSTLLRAERDSGVHDGSELRDASAAMGLLWIRRSLAFQRDLYAHALLVREGDAVQRRGGTQVAAKHPREAAREAYDVHLAPFHGWALRKVFPASLSQMPAREAFIAKFGGIEAEDLDEEYDVAVVRKLRSLVNAWDPLIRCWEEEFERLGLEDTRRV